MKKLEPIKVVKFATNLVVGAGTTKIVHAIISNNVQPENIIDKVVIYAGTAALTGLSVQRSKEFTGAKIDEYVSEWHDRTKDKKADEEEAVTITDL
jgi:hypothetical protein